MRFVVVINISLAALAARHNSLAFPASATFCHQPHCRPFSLTTLQGKGSKEQQSWGGEHAGDAIIAARLVSDAVKLCQEYERRMHKIETATKDSSMQTTSLEKIDGTPVTALDFAIQGHIVSSLTKYEQQQDGNQSFSFVGEEDAEDLRDTKIASMALDLIHLLGSNMGMSEFLDVLDDHERAGEHESGHRSWILDPIDGTRGLLEGKQYCIGLALCVNGKPTVGVLGNPSMQSTKERIMIAIKGHGLRYYNPTSDDFVDLQRKIPNAWHTKDYDVQQWADCSLAYVSDAVLSSSSRQACIDYPPFLLSLGPKTKANKDKIGPEPRPFGPLCHPDEICCGSLVKYFAVASGQVSSFVQFAPSGWVNTWDHAPGILCVQESGGSVFLVDSNGNAPSIGQRKENDAEPSTIPLPLLDKKKFFIYNGIVSFAKEANVGIRKQIVDSMIT